MIDFFDLMTNLGAGVLAFVAPAKAQDYRAKRALFKRGYSAAAKTGPNQRWQPKDQAADTLIGKDQKLIIARCRDLAINNPYISGAIKKICNNVVRQGIRPQAKNKIGGRLNVRLNTQLESAYAKWGKRKNCDVLGHDSISAIQKLVLRHCWTDGGCLLRRVWNRTAYLGFRIEVLETDFLNYQLDGRLANGNIIRKGVEYSAANGRPVKYHIYDSHPGDYIIGYPRTIEVSAEDIIHVFDRERASQHIGVPWFAALVMEAFDLSEYQRFERIGAKLAAAFGIFLKSQFPETNIGKDDPEIPDYIEPGRIQTLPNGLEIQIASHKRPGETYGPYVKTSLRGLSAGAGMSYGAMANDHADSSFSAERAAAMEERFNYQSQQNFLNEKVNDPIWAWVLEGLYWWGGLPGYANADKAEQYLDNVAWQVPGWMWINPLQDAKAAEVDLALGITTRRRLASQRGLDWDEIIDELKLEEEQMKDAKGGNDAGTQETGSDTGSDSEAESGNND